MTSQRSNYFHSGFPPLEKTYERKLWDSIELAMQTGKQYVYRDWKEHWRVSDERPNGDYWEINGNDVVLVCED